MTESSQQTDPRMTSSVVYQLPYMGEVCTDIPYGENNSLMMDIHYPEVRSDLMPAIILVTGFSDPGYQSKMGMKQMEVMWYVSWAKLVAASGFIAITYSNLDPSEDIIKLIESLYDKGAERGIDSKKIGIMSMSGNVSNALAVLMSGMSIRCAALWYGYTIDVGNSKLVADAAELYGFRTPKNMGSEFPDAVPMLIARAGEEENIGLNASIDLFVEEALRRNAPVSLINYPDGNHCFDIIDESKESIGAIKMVLEFFHCYLSD